MARTASRDLWLCLLLPRLGVELFTRSLPDAAAQRPVVLVDGPRVVGLNATARARGLQPGMSLSTAESICADLAVARRDADLELRALERLAIRACRFTPRVSPQPPDALLLEVAGSLRLFRGLDRLQQRVLEDVAGLGYSALPGLAPTPLAAGALARAGRSPDPDRLAAELAFDGRGDDALREAWCTAVADTARPALAGTALGFLERPAAEQEKFEAMGLRTVGDLLRLPRGPLARRFGKDLLAHLDRLTGRRPDPRETVTPPPLFASTVHFLEDVEHTAGLAFPMQRLVGELADWLRLRQLATDRLDWRLRHPRHGEQRLQVRFAGAQHESARLLEFSRLQLERDPSLPAVASLELRVTRLSRTEGDAGALFAGPGEDGAAQEDPALLVDRLRARLGDAICRSVLPADDHRPEHAWRPAPPRPPRPDGRTLPPRGAAPPEGPRPLWLVEPPQPLTDRDGRPFRHGPLELCRGPERIDAGWWDAPPSWEAHAVRDPQPPLEAADDRRLRRLPTSDAHAAGTAREEIDTPWEAHAVRDPQPPIEAADDRRLRRLPTSDAHAAGTEREEIDTPWEAHPVRDPQPPTEAADDRRLRRLPTSNAHAAGTEREEIDTPWEAHPVRDLEAPAEVADDRRLRRLPTEGGAHSGPSPRDYWVARHGDGSHYWIFRELASGRWYLHGIFA